MHRPTTRARRIGSPDYKSGWPHSERGHRCSAGPRDSPRHGFCPSLDDVMSVKSIVLTLALAYAGWALFMNARGAYELFVGRPYADRQRTEYYRHRLSGTPLEKTLRDANLFGKT